MAEKTNYSFAIIAIVAIVAIVGIISLSSSLREKKAEPTAILVDDEGNIIGEAKGVKKVSALKSCAFVCKRFSGEECVACCGNYDVDPKTIYHVCYGKDWKIYYSK